MSNLGSPGDPNLAPVAWSVSGKFLAAAMEKIVNIWQVNGESPIINPSCKLLFRRCCCLSLLCIQ